MARREEVSRMGVPSTVRVRRVQSRRVRDRDNAGQPGVHVPALFKVRDDAPREPHVTSGLLLSEVWLRGSRRLQRRKERCKETTPVGAEVFGRRGDQSTRPEVGNAERERRFHACLIIGQTGSSPTNAGLQAGEVDTLSSSSSIRERHHSSCSGFNWSGIQKFVPRPGSGTSQQISWWRSSSWSKTAAVLA